MTPQQQKAKELVEKECNKCVPIHDSFYLGTTCPKCNRPFRNVLNKK